MSVDQRARHVWAEIRQQVASIERPDAAAIARRSRHNRMVTGASVVAVAALVLGAVALLRVDTDEPQPTIFPGLAANGWVAFTQQDRNDDRDVYLVTEGGSPLRIAGSDTDATAEVCPAFSPDGARLAYGTMPGSSYRGYDGDAELILVDVGDDGSTSGGSTIPIDGASAPPCPTWSPDGRWVAFVDGADVVLADTETEELRRLTDQAATDLEWIPGTDELAIADDGIDVYSVATGEVRSLGVEGVSQLTWAPDGTTVAFSRVARVDDGVPHDSTGIWLVDADGTHERRLTGAYGVNHGIGPVWSPDGRTIVYQRLAPGSAEGHEAVLVSPDDGAEVVISPPTTPGTDGPLTWLPWSVTWSPDGTTLLYVAWNGACDDQGGPDCRGRIEGGGVLAVPVDQTQPPVVLADADWLVGVNDGEPWLPTQAWGRSPTGPDAPEPTSTTVPGEASGVHRPPVDFNFAGPTASGLDAQLYCADVPCDLDFPYEAERDLATELEVTPGGQSARFEVRSTPIALEFDEDSVLVQDGAGDDVRFRLLHADGTEVGLRVLDAPAPAVPGPDVMIIEDIDVYRSGMGGPDDPVAMPHLIDEEAATIQPLDLPTTVDWWAVDVDEALWGGSGCRVFWQRPDGTFAHHDVCSDPSMGDMNPSGNWPDVVDWLEPGRMVVVEWDDTGGPLVVHASLDGGATWERVETDDSAWRNDPGNISLTEIEQSIDDALATLD